MDVRIHTGKFSGKAMAAALLTLAAALALWLFVAANLRKVAVADINKSLGTINAYKTDEISRWLEDHNREAARLSRHSFLGEIVSEEISKPGSRRAQLLPWLKDHCEQKDYAEMAFLSPDGAVITATPGYHPGTEKPFREAFAQAVKKRTPLLTDLYQGASGSPRLTMFSPISAAGRGGTPLCILVIEIDPEHRFYPLLKAAPLFFTNTETLLVRREGDDALFLNPLEHEKDSTLKLRRPLSDEHLPAAAALRGVSGFFAGIDYRGVKVFSFIAPVPGSDWSIITKVDRDSILAPVKTHERLALALILLGAGLLYGVGFAVLMTRQRAAEALLEKSRDLLAETEVIGKVGGWEVNYATGETRWTEELYSIHEVDLTYEPGTDKAMDFYTPASRPVIELAVQRAIELGEPFDLEMEIVTAKGNRRMVHAIGKRDQANSRIYGFFQDITERKQAERKLRESEKIFSEFMEHSPVYVFFKDKDLRALHLSRNYEIMLGKPMEELLAKSMDELFPSDLAKKMIEDDKRILKEGKEVIVEEEFNGRFYRTIKFPILTEGKEPYLAGYTIDITEQKRGDEELRKNNTLMNATQSLARIGGWELDLASHTMNWTEETYHLHDLEPGEIQPKPEDHIARSQECYLPEDRAAVMAAFDRCVKTGEPYDLEFPFITAKGRHLWIRTTAKAEREGDRIVKVIGTLADITERKRMEEERLTHLRYFERMDRINQAIQMTTDPEQMMSNVLKAVLEIFDCDRAWLFYPCDPDSPSFRVPMEITKPEYPGAKTLNVDLPMAPEMARDLREALGSAEPLTYTAGTGRPVNEVSAKQFGVKSQMMVALYPKSGKPWVFGIHQCSYPRVWTPEEMRLMREIGRRLADSLSNLESYRELQESEKKLKDAQRLAQIGSWDLDIVSNKLTWSDEIYRIFEIARDKFEGTYEAFLESIHPEDRDYVDKAYADSLKSRLKYEVGHRLLMKDGRIKHVVECCRPSIRPKAAP